MDSNLHELVVSLQKWAEEKKAEEIKVYDVEGRNDYTDAILVCEGSGSLHNRAIADNILQKAKENQVYVLGKEGYNQGSWILLDLVNVIVHIFDTETRKYYNLEALWDASRKIREQNKDLSPERSS